MEEVYEYYRNKDFRDELVQKIRKVWIMRVLDFIMTDLKRNVVWVFDGDHVPQNKDETRAERRDRIDKIREEMNKAMDEFAQDDFPNPARYRKAFTDFLVSRPPSWEDYQILSLILIHMGIPVVKAWGEGEKTCARLCLPDITPPELLCSAVWSADVDSILFGAPILIQRKRSYVPSGAVSNDSAPDSGQVRIFDASKFTLPLKKLVKVCVAAGCDYLPRGIPGLGLKKSYRHFGLVTPEPSFPEEHQHVLELFEHKPEEVYTIMASDSYTHRENDPLVKWFGTIYC
jgi:5'-3' exonuclease